MGRQVKRSGFKSRAARPATARDPDRVRATPTVVPGAFRASQAVATAPAREVPKSAPVRNETYRRLVAAMPSMAA